MNGTQYAALTGLGIALVVVFGCHAKVQLVGPGQHHGQEDKRSFRIYIYADPSQAGQCLVDWPQATLWKSKHQTVTWVSDDGAPYTVDFGLGQHGSPFSQSAFSVPAGGEVPSGDLSQPPLYYDYGIKDTNNHICKPASDPGFYVK